MMDLLTPWLLAISNALLVPDIVLLLLMFMLTLVYLGGIMTEAAIRHRRRPAWRAFVRDLQAAPEQRLEIEALPAGFGLVARGLDGIRRLPGATEKTLDDLQLEAERLVGRLALGIRLGPILGLAGTLIPLGPALVALASGDIETLSSRLVVAFTTTVLGLLVGGACFAMHALRSRWYTQDISDLEYVASRLG